MLEYISSRGVDTNVLCKNAIMISLYGAWARSLLLDNHFANAITVDKSTSSLLGDMGKTYARRRSTA